MKRKILLFVLLSVFTVIIAVNSLTDISFAENTTKQFSVNAGGACVMEVNSNRELYSYQSNKKLPMASTTKIMTALVALENCDLDSEFIVNSKAVGVEGSSIYLKKGETVTMRGLLYGLMLMSGNDAAEAIAYNVAGSIDAFVDLMNERANKIGALNTHFVNPHGLHDENHYTTAFDLCKIACEALKNDEFKKIVSTKNYTMQGINNNNVEGVTRYFHNKNKMLTQYEGANGVKTGYTKVAGRCLVTSADRNGMQLVSVVLNCPDMWNVSADIMDYAFNNYTYTDILKAYNYFTDIPVTGGKKQYVKVLSIDHVYYPLSSEEQNLTKCEIDIVQVLQAPVEKNVKVGEVKVFFNGDLIAKRDILTIDDTAKKTLFDKISDFFDRLF